MDDTTELETHRQFARRHGVSTKTIDRWADLEVIPDPLRINGRKYHPKGTEPRRDVKRSRPVGRPRTTTTDDAAVE